ncbi:MAG: efflux RND transporter periplasmic adaptor subunit, partial [Armatimonadetes bacterium]|nr:efflux RND transporter periplasmic adaptor subunit [Armatimonadota bacterium]
MRAAQEKVKQAQASLDFARANRAQTPAYKQNLEALKSSVMAAEASLKNVQAQRAETNLVSPLDGYVTSRLMDTGTMASPGQPILVIQDFRQVWVTVPIQEEISRKIYQGQVATVTFDAIAGKTLTGRIAQINPSADPGSRQFAMRVLLENPGNMIKPGMFARVKMGTDTLKQAVTVA